MSETYLPQPTLTAAQARSNQQALALGCDGVLTQYWWPVQQLTDGTAAIVITPGTPFDATTSNMVATDPGWTTYSLTKSRFTRNSTKSSATRLSSSLN